MDIIQNQEPVTLGNSLLALRTNGLNIEVTAKGKAANLLALIIAVCIVAITTKLIVKS